MLQLCKLYLCEMLKESTKLSFWQNRVVHSDDSRSTNDCATSGKKLLFINMVLFPPLNKLDQTEVFFFFFP